MTKEEKRDLYITAIVGGIVLILIMLFVHSSPAAAQPDSLPDAAQTAGVADQTPYNYNIQPYGGSGSPLYIPPNGAVTAPRSGGGSGGGCCDDCGTGTGSSYQNPGVLAYLKLLALGG